MDNLTQKPLLILSLLFLVMLKFVWLPSWEEKQLYWSRTAELKKSVVKSENLLENISMLKGMNSELATMLKRLSAEFPSAENLTKLKLARQQQLEKLFAKHNVSIQQVNWKDGLLDNNVYPLRLDLSVQGELTGFIDMMLELETHSDFNTVTLLDMRMNIDGQSDLKLGSLRGSMSLQFAALTD